MTRGVHSLVPLIVEFDQAENSREREEQEHRVEQDETGYTEPADICES